MPGAEDLKRDSRMDVALGWCCCLEAIEGEREPVPWKSVFCKDTEVRQSQSNSIFQDKVSKEVKSYNPELHWIWIVGGSYEITTENHLFIKLLCKIITFEKVTIWLH